MEIPKPRKYLCRDSAQFVGISICQLSRQSLTEYPVDTISHLNPTKQQPTGSVAFQVVYYFIYQYPIFTSIAKTWPHNKIRGQYPHQWLLGDMLNSSGYQITHYEWLSMQTQQILYLRRIYRHAHLTYNEFMVAILSIINNMELFTTLVCPFWSLWMSATWSIIYAWLV